MNEKFKLTYTVRDTDVGSKNYGMLLNKSATFKNFSEAVRQGRYIANTTINIIGKPVIDLTTNKG